MPVAVHINALLKKVPHFYLVWLASLLHLLWLSRLPQAAETSSPPPQLNNSQTFNNANIQSDDKSLPVAAKVNFWFFEDDK